MKVCVRCGHIFDGDGEICPHCSSRNLFCPRCGAKNAPDAKFCELCGERFEQRKVCDCGAKNSEDATICYACGRALDEDENIPVKKVSPWIIIGAFVIAFAALAIVCLVI